MTLYDPEWGRQKKAELDEVRRQTAARVMAASAAGELRNPNKAPDVSSKPDLYGVEETCKKTWSTDPAVRSEFGEFGRYLAYTKAAMSGRARILGKRRGEA